MKQLSKYMSRKKLKQFSSGIFYSKLSYCLPVFGTIFGLESYKEENSRSTSFTIKDNHNLQVLQNKLNQLILGADFTISTSDLLKETDSLSIQQMITYQTAVTAFRIRKTNKPKYIAERMKVKDISMNLRGRQGIIHQPGYSLSIAKEGFVYQGTSILNKLDENLRNEEKLEKFKTGAREWVKKNIAIKPISKHPNLTAGTRMTQPNLPPDPPDPPDPPLNSIRRFLIPLPKNSSLSSQRRSRTPPTPQQQSPVTLNSIKRYFHPLNSQTQPSQHSSSSRDPK